jgi:hypothetical protein
MCIKIQKFIKKYVKRLDLLNNECIILPILQIAQEKLNFFGGIHNGKERYQKGSFSLFRWS